MNWWHRRSLKLRLALLYATVFSILLLALGVFAFETIEHRLRAELDRQLRIDFDLVEASLDRHGASQILSWPIRGAHGDDGYGRLAAWFEVWSEKGELLLRQWPVPDDNISRRIGPPQGRQLRFRTLKLEDRLWARLMERPFRVADQAVVVRMYRDESNMRHALAEIAAAFLVGAPLTVLLSAAAGFLLARHSLAPLAAMAEQAGRISADSLSERLPVGNPHDELGRMALVFNETIERLDKSFAELRRFTADASHELRTPLTALRTVGEVSLRRDNEAGDLKDSISSMLEEAHRLDTLVDALLILSRAESESTKPALELVDSGKLLDQTAATLAILASDKKQDTSLETENAPRLMADPLLLRQAILNLLHNAIRYCPERSSITLRAFSSDDQAIIEIEDDGPGIPHEHRLRIFERFARIDPARSRAEGGSGLGLAIAQSAIKKMGGNIELIAKASPGSLFRISLPLAPPPT